MKVPILFFDRIHIIVLVLFVSGCNPVFYAPTSHNLPLFREKHEIHITATGISTDQADGFEGQAAYSITNHFGIIANGSYLSGENETKTRSGNGYLGEFGAGYFKPIGENFVFEIFTGGGTGKVSTTNNNGYTFDLNFAKYFLQPTIGYSTKFADIAFSPKIAMVQFKHGLTENYETDVNGNYNLYFTGKRNYIAFEPALTIRGGWKYTKLQLQIVQSYQEIPQANRTSVSLGLHLMLAPRFRNSAE
jgi:hypothetical protein